jgi:hypothetical protein
MSYHQALQEVHRNAGAPAVRTIADAAIEPVSRQTVHDLLAGKRLAPWKTVENVLSGMSVGPGVVAHLKGLWQEAHRELNDGTLPPGSAMNREILTELQAIRALLEKLVEER